MSEHWLIKPTDELLFAAAQLFYAPKHRVSDTKGSYVVEEMIWYSQERGDTPKQVALSVCPKVERHDYQDVSWLCITY